jgi:hypothetical protein
MKPGPRKDRSKQRYSIEELFEKWVRREKCPRCGKPINYEGIALHLDFCNRKKIVQPLVFPRKWRTSKKLPVPTL